MATTTQITPEEALAKFNAFVQSQQMQDYLSQRATQYGTTPGGAVSETGWTGGETLANPFAGLTDFGTKKVPIYGRDEELSTIVGEEEQAKSASEVLRDAFIEQLGHKSTFTKAYDTTKKDDKGNPVEVDLNSLTPEQLNSGQYAIHVGGKTGGTERERMAQLYVPMGGQLIPVGDPEYYKGEHPDARNVANILKFASIASLPFGGIGGLLGNITGTAGSTALGGLAALGEGAGAALTAQAGGSGLAGFLANAGLPAAAANIGANALVQGGLQGLIAEGTGGEFLKGFGQGALSGGIATGLGELGAATGVDKSLGSLYNPAKSLVASGLTSAALGQPFDISEAAKNAAMKFGLDKALASTDLAPDQAKAMGAFLEFLGREV
jgi:hypothetical protein